MKPRLNISFSKKNRKEYRNKTILYQNQENEFLLSNARSGILLALQSLKLPPNSMVGIMAYNCRSVMDAVAQAGHEIVFIDVTKKLQIDLFDLQRKKDSISALIVSHLFGLMNDVRIIRELYPQLPIIEDCAHAFGISPSGGDFAVFSIGQGKFPSVGNGGIIRINNPQYLHNFSELYSILPEYTQIDSLIQYCSMSIRAFLYTPSVYSVIYKLKKKGRIEKKRIVPQKMSLGIQAMLAVTCEDFPEKRKEQISHAIRLKELLEGCSLLKGNIQDIFWGTNAFMLIVDCENKEQLKKKLIENEIESSTHFEQCIEWAKEYGYKEGLCPNCEYLIHHLMMIPTYYLIEHI